MNTKWLRWWFAGARDAKNAGARAKRRETVRARAQKLAVVSGQFNKRITSAHKYYKVDMFAVCVCVRKPFVCPRARTRKIAMLFMGECACIEYTLAHYYAHIRRTHAHALASRRLAGRHAYAYFYSQSATRRTEQRAPTP